MRPTQKHKPFVNISSIHQHSLLGDIPLGCCRLVTKLCTANKTCSSLSAIFSTHFFNTSVPSLNFPMFNLQSVPFPKIQEIRLITTIGRIFRLLKKLLLRHGQQLNIQVNVQMQPKIDRKIKCQVSLEFGCSLMLHSFLPSNPRVTE